MSDMANNLVLFWRISAVLWFIAGASVSPPTSVPDDELGFYLNPFQPRPKDTLEIFLDPLCTDCYNCWPVVKSVQQHFGADKLNVLLHQVPLPIHRNSHLVMQGSYVIDEELPSKVFDYIEVMLSNYNQLSNSATSNLNQSEIIERITQLAVQSTGIDAALFKSKLPSKVNLTNQEWEHTSARLGNRTPMYFVNGQPMGNSNPTFKEWLNFLTPIVNA